MAMTPIPPLDRTSPSFKSDLDTLFGTRVPTFIDEANVLQANLNAIAAGGAYAIPYTFGSVGVSGGFLTTFAGASQNLATQLHVDITDARGAAVGALLDSLVTSSSTSKGAIRVQAVNDVSKFLTFDVTGLVTNATNKYFSVTCNSYSSANPFTYGAPVMLFFQRTGDEGKVGPPATNYCALLGQAAVGAAVANIDFLNIFTSAYDRYVIDVQGVNPSAGSPTLQTRLAKAGAVDATNSYIGLGAHGATISTSISALDMVTISTGTLGGTFTIEVKNTNDTSVAIKGVGVRGVGWTSGTSCTSVAAEGGYSSANAVTGFRLYWSTGANFTRGTVRIYGFKNS